MKKRRCLICGVELCDDEIKLCYLCAVVSDIDYACKNTKIVIKNNQLKREKRRENSYGF